MGLVPTIIANLEREKHSFSQNNPCDCQRNTVLFSAWKPKKEKKKKTTPLMLPISSVYESTGPNWMYNSEFLQRLLVSFGRYLGHTRPHQSQAYFHMLRGSCAGCETAVKALMGGCTASSCSADLKFKIERGCQISSKVSKKNLFLFYIIDVAERYNESITWWIHFYF